MVKFTNGNIRGTDNDTIFGYSGNMFNRDDVRAMNSDKITC